MTHRLQLSWAPYDTQLPRGMHEVCSSKRCFLLRPAQQQCRLSLLDVASCTTTFPHKEFIRVPVERLICTHLIIVDSIARRTAKSFAQMPQLHDALALKRCKWFPCHTHPCGSLCLDGDLGPPAGPQCPSEAQQGVGVGVYCTIHRILFSFFGGEGEEGPTLILSTAPGGGRRGKGGCRAERVQGLSPKQGEAAERSTISKLGVSQRDMRVTQNVPSAARRCGAVCLYATSCNMCSCCLRCISAGLLWLWKPWRVFRALTVSWSVACTGPESRQCKDSQRL